MKTDLIIQTFLIILMTCVCFFFIGGVVGFLHMIVREW